MFLKMNQSRQIQTVMWLAFKSRLDSASGFEVSVVLVLQETHQSHSDQTRNLRVARRTFVQLCWK